MITDIFEYPFQKQKQVHTNPSEMGITDNWLNEAISKVWAQSPKQIKEREDNARS